MDGISKDEQEKVNQVIEFAGCSWNLAVSALIKHNGDVEASIGAIMEGSVEEAPSLPSSNSASNQSPDNAAAATTWSTNYQSGSNKSQSTSIVPYNDNKSFQQASSNGRANARQGWQNDKETEPSQVKAGTGSENNPITIGAGPDEVEDPELAKALAASLEGNPQGLPPLYGPNPSSGNFNDQGNSNEDDDLKKAIAASMEGGPSNPIDVDSNGFDSGNVYMDSMIPYLNESLKVGPESRRSPNSPLVLVPRYPALYMISLLLQALFNANPVKHAYLQFSPPDSRITDAHDPERSLLDYWRGNSPNGMVRQNARDWTNVAPRYVDAVDTTTRVQSLFAFMQYSHRSSAVIGDIFEKIPTAVMVMNSEDKGPSKVSASFLDYLVQSLKLSLEMSTGPSIGGRISRGGKSSWNFQMLASIISSGEVAASPAIPVSQRRDPPIQKDLNEVGVCQVELRPTEIYNDVQSALHDVFQNSEAQPVLLTVPAQALCLQVRPGVLSSTNTNNNNHSNNNAITGNNSSGLDPNWRPIKLQPRIYLDRYLWESHDGLQMEWGFRRYSEQIKALEVRKRDLERYRVELLFHEGKDVLELLRQSIKFFETVEPNGEDQFRAEREKDSAPALRQILEKVESDVAKIEVEQKRLEGEIFSLRKTMQAEIESCMDEPRYQKRYPYDLSSILMWDENSSWGYFLQDGTWWKVEDGKAEESTEEAALNDPRGSSTGRGVYFLVYANSNPGGHLANLPQLDSKFRLAIDGDNDLLEAELASLENEGQNLKDENQRIEQDPAEQVAEQQQPQLQPQPPPTLPPRRVLTETNPN